MTAEAQPAPAGAAPEFTVAPVTLADSAAPAPAPLAEATAPALQPRVKKTWREERWERRRRRMWFEEVLGWVLVALILLSLYYIAVVVLDALGTSPAAIMNGINAITSNL